MNASLPTSELLAMQNDWLQPARSRLLRIAEIARKARVLDLGAAFGHSTCELIRRGNGSVFALDLSLDALRNFTVECSRVCADARRLPYLSSSLDLVFCQNVLLWVKDPESVVGEIFRVLTSGGKSVLIEPDYGGMIEYPPEVETGSVWRDALIRNGADPYIGRKLPLLLSRVGFRLQIEMLPRVVDPSPARFEFLKELALTSEESTTIEKAAQASSNLGPGRQVAHLPYFLIVADRP